MAHSSYSSVIRFALLAFIAVLCWMFFFYQPIFMHPNAHMFTISGDGIKAYAVYAGHIKNDISYIDYSNMNYPYGQSFIFTDGQFVIANKIKWLSEFSPWFETHSIGIYNLIMLLSFPLCAFFLSLIFSRTSIPKWYNVAASFCIAILAPQVWRLVGHLTLTYAFCIPLYWFLLIKFFEAKRKFYYTILIILFNSFLFFIHPYYTIMLSFFTFCFLVVWIIFERQSFKKRASTYVGLILQILIPILFTNGFIYFTDHHQGRPSTPSGFWDYNATLFTIFGSAKSPLTFLYKLIFSFKDLHWEGWAYIGFPLVCFFLYCIFRILKYVIKFNFRNLFHPTVPKWLSYSLIASVFVLLYSMAFPFRFNFDFLLDWFPVLLQFRAIGRFAWIFYFVFSVFGYYSIWKIYRYLNGKKLRGIAITLMFLTIAITCAEAWYHHEDMSSVINQPPNYFNKDCLPREYHELIRATDSVKKDYQCLVPLPFFLIGNDNFTTNDADISITASMTVSHWCNFPMLASSAARSSIPEARKSLQFFSYPFIQKDLKNDLPSTLPFLLLVSHGDLDMQETYWLNRSNKIWANDAFELRRLNYDDVFNSTLPAEWDHFDKVRDSLMLNSDGWLLSHAGFFYYNNFDTLQADKIGRGNGALQGSKNEYHIIMDKQKLALDPNREYILSYWYYNEGDARNQYDFIIAETDPKIDKTDWTFYFSPVRSKNIDGLWSLVEEKFRIQDTTHLISLLFPKNDHSKQTFYADELMIRPADADVYKIIKTDSSGKVTALIKNNYNFAR